MCCWCDQILWNFNTPRDLYTSRGNNKQQLVNYSRIVLANLNPTLVVEPPICMWHQIFKFTVIGGSSWWSFEPKNSGGNNSLFYRGKTPLFIEELLRICSLFYDKYNNKRCFKRWKYAIYWNSHDRIEWKNVYLKVLKEFTRFTNRSSFILFVQIIIALKIRGENWCNFPIISFT